MVQNNFSAIDRDIEDMDEGLSERQLEITIASLLLDKDDHNLKVFEEYPYNFKSRKAYCDLVVTEKDCKKVIHWIEIKPFLMGYSYWTPSKFFGEGVCREDIEKLNEAKKSNNSASAWFLLLLYVDSKDDIEDFRKQPRKYIDNTKDPVGKTRKSLTPLQVIRAISAWAGFGEPSISEPIERSKNLWCYLVVWDVREYQEIISSEPNKDGEYLIDNKH